MRQQDKILEKIKADSRLAPFIRPACEDFGMSVAMESSISPTDYLIIKVDYYYNSLHIEKCPASPDCLIIQKCQEGGYAVTIVELKNISRGKGYTIQNVVEKFETCLQDFMLARFAKYFSRDYKRILLYFVTNIDIYRRDRGLAIEVLMGKRFVFRNKKCMIDPRMPIPKIKPCY